MSLKKAIVLVGKSQYLIEPGQQILVDRLPVDSGKYKFDHILLAVDGEKTWVGQPELANVSIDSQIINRIQGEKIRVEKYKAKSRYHKVRGSRSQLTQLQINEIDIREK